MNQAEIEAQRNAARIVRVTNPFDFEYTHAWGGVPYTLPVGKSLLFPFPLGDHLATHLARQALIRKAPLRDEKEIDGKGKDRPLWSEESIEELKKTIMVEEYTEAPKETVSEAEQMRRKIEELNRAFADLSTKVDNQAPQTVAGTTPQTVQEPAVVQTPVETVTDAQPAATVTAPVDFKDKAEVIAELKKRGITFDARKGKSELEKLLTEQQA